MAAIAGHRLTLDPMRKCSNAFFSETTNMIKAKLYMNVHWMVLYNSEKKLEIRKVYRRRTPSDGFGPGELKITVKTSSIPFFSSVLDLIKIDKYIILPLNDCDWQECYFDLS
jgi:hypothetical protein